MRPRVITKCVAQCYAGPDERIIEFSSKGGGGLIAFHECELPSGKKRLRVDVYRIDDTVEVAVGSKLRRKAQ